MRNRAYILILVFLLSLSVPILSSSEQIVVEDIEENILPNWDYDEYKESETSVAVLGDVMVSCEKDFSPKKLSVRNYSGEILWEKNIDCQYLEVSNTGDYFVVLSIFHDGEVNWYSMQVYSVLSSEELWTYDFEWGNQPYVGISGNGHFITAVTANSGLFYFSKASNQSLWESSPLSDYQEREVTSMGHSFMGMSMSYDGKVVVSTGSAIHYFEHPYQYPLWSKDFHLEGDWPTVVKAKISSDGEKIAYKYGALNSDPWGDPYLEEIFAISNDDSVVIFSHSAETQFSDPNGIDMVHISGDGSTTIYATRDPESGTQSVISAVYSEEGFVIETKWIPRTSTSSNPAFTQLQLSQNGNYTFVGNDKVMLMLDSDSLSPIATLSPLHEEHDPENVYYTQFSDIQSSNDGNFVFTEGRYFYRTENSASDVEIVYFRVGFFTGRGDADNDGVEDVYDDCPDTEEYPVLDGLSLEGCSWGQLDYDADGANNSIDLDIFDPSLSFPVENGASFEEWALVLDADDWSSFTTVPYMEGLPPSCYGYAHGIACGSQQRIDLHDLNGDGRLDILFENGNMVLNQGGIGHYENLRQGDNGISEPSDTAPYYCTRANDLAPWECGRSQGTWAGGLIGYGTGYGSPGRSWSFDPDLDGDRDLFLSNGINNMLFYNVGDGYYYSETESGFGSTLSSSTPQQLTRTLTSESQDIIPVDFDRDGEIELFCMWTNAPQVNRCSDPRVYFINDTTQAELSNQDSIRLDVCETKNNTINTDSSISILWAYEQNSGYHVVSCSNGRVWPDHVHQEEYHTVVWFDGYEVVRQQEFVSRWSGVGGLGDLNGDGWIDHVYSPFGTLDESGNPLSNCTVALGDGTGLNSEIILFETSSEQYNSYSNCNEGVHLIDIDGDGDLDISSDHSFLMNNQGTYEMAIHYGMNGDSSFWGDHRLVDWDGDGDLDRLMPGHIIYNPWFPDQDFDGIDDLQDQCPDTEDIDSVDEFGCSVYQIDTDEDGISDGYDICPQSDSSSSVDNNGCSLSQKDSDNDGISDSLDSCPNTPNGVTVNLNGCQNGNEEPSDSDGDGVFDVNDICDNTELGSTVDTNGCSTSQKDSDLDGVIDYGDNCPETEIGESVDENGCAADEIPDYDTDGDGIRDSTDLCLQTPIGSIVDSDGCLLNQVGTIDAKVTESNLSQSYIIIAISVAICALLVVLIRRNDSYDEFSYLDDDLSKASSLQNKLNNTINDNLKLRGDRELLQRQLRNKDLTESENAKLRKELNMMQSMTDTNVSEMERMAFELQELRSIIEKSNKEEILKSENYQDSVHQGDNIGHNIESQTINDADAIARVALESYRQAMKDLREEF